MSSQSIDADAANAVFRQDINADALWRAKNRIQQSASAMEAERIRKLEDAISRQRAARLSREG